MTWEQAKQQVANNHAKSTWDDLFSDSGYGKYDLDEMYFEAADIYEKSSVNQFVQKDRHEISNMAYYDHDTNRHVVCVTEFNRPLPYEL